MTQFNSLSPIEPIHEDVQLINAINDGDEEAFAELYHRYRDWIVQLAYRFTGNHEDALDVLQETFGYLLKKVPNLRLTARITTFLYPVVRNLSLARRHKKQPQLQEEELLDQMPSSPSEVTSELETIVQCLPGIQREVLLMRFVDDLTLEEIALALKIPTGTVKSRLHNAIQTLRNDPGTKKYFME